MPEEWKTHWEDYYETLNIAPEADDKEIRGSYRDKCFIFHPDRLIGAPESARLQAEKELRKINRAYEVLKDPQKRQEYHSEWLKRISKTHFQGADTSTKPKPVIEPGFIRFDNAEPGEIKRASFVIRNIGGPYNKIWFSNPDSWVRVVRWDSVDPSQDSELPLRVEIETESNDWNTSYSEYIRVKLDEEETQVRIDLRTKPEPVKEKVKSASTPLPVIPSSSIRPPPSPSIKIRPWQIITVVVLFIFIIWIDFGGVSRIWSPDTGSQDQSIQYGQRKQAQLSNTKQVNTWRFFGNAGDVITIRTIPKNGRNMDIFLYAPNNQLLARAEHNWLIGTYNNVIMSYRLPSTGNYTIVTNLLRNEKTVYEIQISSTH